MLSKWLFHVCIYNPIKNINTDTEESNILPFRYDF